MYSSSGRVPRGSAFGAHILSGAVLDPIARVSLIESRSEPQVLITVLLAGLSASGRDAFELGFRAVGI